MSSKLKICPTCGQAIMPEIKFPKMRQRIYDSVVKRPFQVTRNDLMEAMYFDDPNGGTERFNIVNVQISFINRRLATFGVKIRGTGGPGSTYGFYLL